MKVTRAEAERIMAGEQTVLVRRMQSEGTYVYAEPVVVWLKLSSGRRVGRVELLGLVPVGHLVASLELGTERHPIPSAPNYSADLHGRIWSTARNYRNGPRPVSEVVEKSRGYSTIVLHVRRQRLHTTTHKVVAEAWLGPRPEGLEVRHMDGSRTQSAPWNLRYGTKQDNATDMILAGRRYQLNRVLSDDQVVAIKADFAAGMQATEAGRKYGISTSAACKVKNGHSYGPLPEAVDDSLARSRWAWLLGRPIP